MKTLILLLFTISVQAQCLKADIILVGDYSSSVQGNERYIAQAFNTFVDRFELSEETIRIGIIKFATSAKLVQPLSSNKKDIKQILDIMAVTPAIGSTFLNEAFDVCRDEFSSNYRPDAVKMVILISDGDPTSEEMALVALELLKVTTGAGLCTIFVDGQDANPEFLSSLSDCYSEISSFELLVQQIKNLEICL